MSIWAPSPTRPGQPQPLWPDQTTTSSSTISAWDNRPASMSVNTTRQNVVDKSQFSNTNSHNDPIMPGQSSLSRSATYGPSRSRMGRHPLAHEDLQELQQDDARLEPLAGGSHVRRHQSLTATSQPVAPVANRSRHATLGSSSPLHQRTASDGGAFGSNVVRATSVKEASRRNRTLSIDTTRSNNSGSSTSSVRSPILGGSSPWSPTAEESAQLASTSSSLSTAVSPLSAGVTSDDMTGAFSELALASTTPQPSQAQAQKAPKLSALNTSFEHVAMTKGPSSAAPYVRPIGHSYRQSQDGDTFVPTSPLYLHNGAATAAPGGRGSETWRMQKAIIAGDASSSQYGYSIYDDGTETTFDDQTTVYPETAMAENEPVSAAHLAALSLPFVYAQPVTQQSAYAHAVPVNVNVNANVNANNRMWPIRNMGMAKPQPMGQPESTDIMSMISKKGYNPIGFDCQPRQAKFCVIKSYTEEDVHKSIKYEIWSSTRLGNQRLDRIFREAAAHGPIYLFFSVNGSGHFCGVAEMLTPVDETVDSKVWADNKWKGIFKVRWIFVKDVPNSALRHLKLTNTNEQKPVTSSRDTQEVPFAIGVDMLKIISSYHNKTSLLQDWLFYEARDQSKELMQTQPPPTQPQPHLAFSM